jgi:hypothetical protein
MIANDVMGSLELSLLRDTFLNFADLPFGLSWAVRLGHEKTS